jgi:hypothetical protein
VHPHRMRVANPKLVSDPLRGYTTALSPRRASAGSHAFVHDQS